MARQNASVAHCVGWPHRARSGERPRLGVVRREPRVSGQRSEPPELPQAMVDVRATAGASARERRVGHADAASSRCDRARRRSLERNARPKESDERKASALIERATRLPPALEQPGGGSPALLGPSSARRIAETAARSPGQGRPEDDRCAIRQYHEQASWSGPCDTDDQQVRNPMPRTTPQSQASSGR